MMRTFDINDLVLKYQDKDLFDILSELSKEVEHLDTYPPRANRNNDFSTYQFAQYRDHAGDFLYFLNTGGTPSGIGIEGLRKFLPIIQGLVNKGQLKETVLERFSVEQ